ncbi:MAG: DnaA/Hda family protein [Myxococcota bacterium]
MTSVPKVWRDALRLLQDEIPEFAFEAWIAPIAVKLSEGRLLLGCPNAFHRERVRTHFSDGIQRCWQRACAPLDANVGSAAGHPAGEAIGNAIPIAIVDMKDFAAAAGHAIEIRIPARQAEAKAVAAERVSVASGVIGAARRGELGSRGIALAGPDRIQSLDPQNDTSNDSRIELDAANATIDGLDPIDRNAGEAARRSAGEPASSPALHAVPTRSSVRAEPARRTAQPDVLRVDSGPRFGLDGEPAQGELPFSFESFVVGPCNALAREAALALARRRQNSLNQLYLGGESGMGKTHLARAAAIEARRQAGGAPISRGLSGGFAGFGARARGESGGARSGIVYTTAEQFTTEFVSAMRNGRSEEFQKRYRAPIGLLIVEDVQFFDGRIKTQLELFHTVQHVLDAGGRVLLTGDRSPHALSGLSDRMRTQLSRGFVAELERPDAIVRRHILRAKAAAGGVHLPADCLDLLVESTGGSVRDIESVLIQVVTTASLLGRTIDLALTRDAIARKAGTTSPLAPRRVATSEIVRIVAGFFGKRPEALAARSRRRDVLLPRQLAMYLAHRYTDASFAEIGRCLGRDHPSVRNAISRIERLVLENAPLRYQVEALSERVDQTLASQRKAPALPEREG